METILARDWESAKKIHKDIEWAYDIWPATRETEFANYNIQWEKGRMAEAGYCKPGPYRPPYNIVSEEWAESARENGRRWAQLQKKYSEIRAQAVKAG
jgi:hypothetical protein